MRNILEKKIIGKINQIKSGKITPKESNIGLLFKNLQTIDEALYISLITRYKETLNELEK
jgi:hypothetical protein